MKETKKYVVTCPVCGSSKWNINKDDEAECAGCGLPAGPIYREATEEKQEVEA